MVQTRVDLKNPWFAACLAYLLPGAGHIYQGRYFKGILYCVCILGTFLYGMHMGEWRVVYARTEGGETGQTRSIGYFAQIGVGLPALAAIAQAKRYDAAQTDRFGRDVAMQTRLDAALDTTFEGVLTSDQKNGEVAGRLQLNPNGAGTFGPEIRGQFVGTLKNGDPIKVQLAEPMRIGPEIYSSPRRFLQCEVLDDQQHSIGTIEGSVPRRFRNWFQVPLHDRELQDLHGRLGRYYELAQVFTWIAGLLNVLAVWDALEGPAYGYGDEDDQDDAKESAKEAEAEAELLTADVSQ